ncbi:MULTISPECIES: cytochrome P450 [Sorangium]|uniref:cytochrome P450 n=1 Tax=Sorangium TaxID=39643 RepID=UPI003D9C44AF
MSTDPEGARAGDSYNPFVSPHKDDPYPFYARARRSEPVFYSPVLDLWVVTRFEDVQRIARNTVDFSSHGALRGLELCPAAARVAAEGYPIEGRIINDDPPVHTRLRAFVNQVLDLRRTAAHEPRIRAIAGELVDGFADDGSADLVSRFAKPMPLLVLSPILGLPLDDLPQIRRWIDDAVALVTRPMPEEEQVACARSRAAYQHHIIDIVRARRRERRNDLVSALIDVQIQGEPPLSDVEIMNLVISLIDAAGETTAHLLGTAVWLLLRDGEAWRSILREPAGIPAAVEEALRVEPPVNGLPRLCKRDVEVGGVRIPAGARVYLLYASANHDEERFEAPEQFCLARKAGERHMSFGSGIHHCPGAALARAQARIAIEVLRDRLPDLRLAGEGPPSFLPAFLVRGLTRLDVAWDPPARRPGA